MTLFSLLFQGIPEIIALTSLAFTLAKADTDWKKISILGSVLAIAIYLIRLLPITFGIHTIICIALLIIFVNTVAKVDISTSVFSAISSMIILILVETLTNNLIFYIFNFSINTITEDPFLATIVGIPQVIILFLVNYIIKIKLHKKGEGKKINEI